MLENKYKIIASLIVMILITVNTVAAKNAKSNCFMQAKTVFQVNNFYDARLAIPSDGVIIHRHGDNLETLTKSFKSWENFLPCIGRMFFADSDGANEYWTGRWDGTPHPDDREMDAASNIVLCSGVRPYMVPTDGWIKYVNSQGEMALKAGAVAILPEEPLAHVHTGYSKSFKKLWVKHYKFPWQAENSSALARYLTAQL